MVNELLTADELAERLQVSRQTVIAWAKAGKIPEMRPTPRIRRFDLADVLIALKAAGPQGAAR